MHAPILFQMVCLNVTLSLLELKHVNQTVKSFSSPWVVLWEVTVSLQILKQLHSLRLYGTHLEVVRQQKDPLALQSLTALTWILKTTKKPVTLLWEKH